MKNLILVLMACALAACSKSSSDDVCTEVIPPSDGRPTILVIGDSISIGWYDALESSGALANYQVVHNPCNAEYSAYTLVRIDSWLAQRPQYYAIVWNNGLWDIADWIGATGAEYASNETAIANKIKAKTTRPLFLLTTGVPVGTPYRTDAHVAAFNGVIEPVMVSLSVPTLDLYTASHSAPIVNEHSAAGDPHYTLQGYLDIAALVLGELNTLYGIN